MIYEESNLQSLSYAITVLVLFLHKCKKNESTNSLGSYHLQDPVYQGKHCRKLLVQNVSKTYRSLWRKRKCS